MVQYQHHFVLRPLHISPQLPSCISYNLIRRYKSVKKSQLIGITQSFYENRLQAQRKLHRTGDLFVPQRLLLLPEQEERHVTQRCILSVTFSCISVGKSFNRPILINMRMATPLWKVKQSTNFLSSYNPYFPLDFCLIPPYSNILST